MVIGKGKQNQIPIAPPTSVVDDFGCVQPIIMVSSSWGNKRFCWGKNLSLIVTEYSTINPTTYTEHIIYL